MKNKGPRKRIKRRRKKLHYIYRNLIFKQHNIWADSGISNEGGGGRKRLLRKLAPPPPPHKDI